MSSVSSTSLQRPQVAVSDPSLGSRVNTSLGQQSWKKVAEASAVIPPSMNGLLGSESSSLPIFPKQFRTREFYRCSIPIETALINFKNKYPEKFINNPNDPIAHETYLRYQKAYDFWLVGKWVGTKTEIECHQEIQAIRAFLFETELNEEAAEVERQFQRPVPRFCISVMEGCSRNAKVIFIAALILAIIAIAVRYSIKN